MGCDYCIATNLIIVFKINDNVYEDTICGEAQGKYFANMPEDDEEVMNMDRKPLEYIYENNEYTGDTFGLYYKTINDHIDEHNSYVESRIESDHIYHHDSYYLTKISLCDIVSISRETVVWKRL